MKDEQELDFNRLVDWIDGQLSDEEVIAIASQVAAAGSETQATVEWLRSFKRTSQEVTLLPPREMRPELVARFQEWTATRRGPSLFQQFIAALTFDSKLQAPAPARSAAVEAPPRQLIFTSSATDVTLYIQARPNEPRLDISGQLFPQGEVTSDWAATFSIELQSGTEILATATTDELYEFSLRAVTPGVYDLVATSDQVAIRLEEVEISL